MDKEADPFRFDKPIYVLCEGNADASLVKELLRRENLEGFTVNFAKGYQNFATHVRGLTTSSDWWKIQCLLIIGDNDTNPNERWQNARNALVAEGLPAPTHHANIATGTHDKPSTGIFMVPRENTDGALETLLMEAILHEHEGLTECLQKLEDCPATDCSDWDVVKRAKMQFQTTVAIKCQDDPSASAAYIWSKNHNPVQATSPVFDELAAFLRQAANI